MELANRGNVFAPLWADWIARNTLGVLGIDIDTFGEADYIAFVSATLSTVTMIVMLGFVVVPIMAHLKQRRDLARASPIDVFPIHEQGKDDLREMFRYFRNASTVIIFSGDFSWVLEHRDLQKLLTSLAQKGDLRLVSYRSETEISKGWQKVADQQSVTDWEAVLTSLRESFRFHQKKFKFSLICTGSDQWSFMAQVHNFPSEDQVSNVGVRGFKGEHARVLVDIVQRFCDWKSINELRSWGAD